MHANATHADAGQCLVRATQRVYDTEYAGCPRSPEWKAGALRGLRRQAGLQTAACHYPCGTAQSDAWLSGNLVGMTEWSYRVERALA